MDNDRTHGDEGDISGEPNNDRGVSHVEGKEGQAVEYKLLPWQSEFLTNEGGVDFKGYAAGKTFALIMAPIVKGFISGPARRIVFIGATNYTVDSMAEVYRNFGAKFEGHRRRFVFPNGTTLYCLSSGQSLISLNGDLALVDDFRESDSDWLEFVKRKFKMVFALGWGHANSLETLKSENVNETRT